MLAAGPTQAVNILVNPGFESPPTGHLTYPPAYTGWTYFSPPVPASYYGDYWVDSAVAAHSGTYYWKEWGALYSGTNNVAGIYQTLSSAPGAIYQASGWLYINSADAPSSANTIIWLQVEFLDSSSNLLALDKSANFSINAGENTWIQYQVNNACDITQPVSTGDPTFNTYAITSVVSQLVAPAGTASVRYRYCYLQNATDGGSSYLDDADLEVLSGPIPPVISNLNPLNEIFVPPASGVSFNVSSPSGQTINTNSIHLVLNGTDVSKNMTFSGSSSNWNVFYGGLQSNTTYNVSITVTDSVNFAASAKTSFQTTWVGVPPYTYLWEAEDWDFSCGMYIENPDLCNSCCQTNCYFGQVGNLGQLCAAPLDEYSSSINVPTKFYRPNDFEGTAPSGDFTRPNLAAASRTDYCINPYNYTDWVNYTRDWPTNGTNWWIIGRFANGASVGGLSVSVVTPTSTNLVGCFPVNPTASWTTYQFVYLQDTNLDGQNATVALHGTETLQIAATLPPGTAYGNGGNALPTFYMLVPAIPDLPFLSNLYPTGKHPFETTNALSFTVTTTAGATFSPSGIQLIVDGNDVSSSLVITGSATSNRVVYPFLPRNEMHKAIINVTNSLGHGISLTNQFDTFAQSNVMFEAEDYDYNGGQYINFENYYPDCYSSMNLLSPAAAEIDFHHTPAGEAYPTDWPYRTNGIPQAVSQDYLRADYVGSFSSDYQLNFFAGGDWANYTRDFPAGSFNVYARSSGVSFNTMNLGQVVSGAGTTNQVIKHLGQWSALGTGINNYGWLPLTDAGGVAPVILKLGGVSTLQVGTPTGDCYPNYFMLVPASGINLSATRVGNNINISFPTQPGGNYRVFYKTSLTAGNWIQLTSVLGDGTVKTATDSNPSGSLRYYKVTSP